MGNTPHTPLGRTLPWTSRRRGENSGGGRPLRHGPHTLVPGTVQSWTERDKRSQDKPERESPPPPVLDRGRGPKTKY